MRALLGALRISSCSGLSTESSFQLPEELEDSTIGLSCQVIVDFAESALPSDRGFSCQVIVDKSVYPKALLTVAPLPLPRQGRASAAK